MTTPLSEAEIAAVLADEAGLTGWSHRDGALEKTFKFKSFKEALSFMVRVGFEAEAMNHHPDWTNVYNRVDLRLSTHDAGNKVTSKDVKLAQVIEKIAWVG